MSSLDRSPQSRLGTVGWLVVLVGGGLLVLQGAAWFFDGPETALTNIAERTTLDPDAFRRGTPSAFDVISIVARQQAIYGASLGVLTILVAWHGYRGRSRWAWWPCWVVVAAFAAAGMSFALSGGPQIGVFYAGFAVVVGAGLALARARTPREDTPS
jgi:hypothetical protein